MTGAEFRDRRRGFGRTQRQLADLLGVSVRAVHSFEQGWRKIPVHVERQMWFLAMLARRVKEPAAVCCWKIRRCPPDVRQHCPAWELRAGDLCWFINGTMCRGRSHRDWGEKMRICRMCEVFAAAVGPVAPGPGDRPAGRPPRPRARRAA